MIYCTNCLNLDTRPGTEFTDKGLCPACYYEKNKPEVNWEERDEVLKEIVQFGKDNSSNGYDCIIGVSGGKDSTRQALFVKETLGMNPLLVCLAYPPEQITQKGVDNLSNLISKGFDCITINPDPITWKKLVQKGFFEYGNYLKACEMALFASVPRFAIAYQIPLIWWGENSALQLGESSIMGETGYDGNNLRNMNTLGGGDITWMLDHEIRKNNILQHTYPSISEMEKVNIKIVFLGYFWEDWSNRNNGTFAALQGVRFRKNNPAITQDPYGISSLDEDWVAVNQGIKYLKFGFGRISDYMNEEIRLGKRTREEGVELCEKYDGMFGSDYLESFCKYIGISRKEFWKEIDRFVNRKLFKRLGEGKYERKFVVGKGLKKT